MPTVAEHRSVIHGNLDESVLYPLPGRCGSSTVLSSVRTWLVNSTPGRFPNCLPTTVGRFIRRKAFLMSRLKKTIASGAVAALSGTGAFLAFGGQTAQASTPVGGSVAFPFGPPVTLITTYESFLGDIRYDCSLYAMTEMLASDADEALEMLSFSETNFSESCGPLAGYGNFGFGFIV